MNSSTLLTPHELTPFSFILGTHPLPDSRQPKCKLILRMLKINSICYINPLSRYFVSAGLSPSRPDSYRELSGPSPEVGGA